MDVPLENRTWIRRTSVADLQAGRANEMGKGRDRGQRRRGFDDDEYSAPQSYDSRSRQPARSATREVAPSGPSVDGIVKWFNPEKGFGFVELADGSGDVFLHSAVLEAAGHETVDSGATLSVQVGWGQKGRQIAAVLAIDVTTAAPARAKSRSSSRAPSDRERADPATASNIEGTVKWFNGEKGFGFVGCTDGEKDVFVHMSVVERAGLSSLGEGQRLAMKVVKTPKGREAISITLLD
jgi:cold shock protein